MISVSEKVVHKLNKSYISLFYNFNCLCSGKDNFIYHTIDDANFTSDFKNTGKYKVDVFPVSSYTFE